MAAPDPPSSSPRRRRGRRFALAAGMALLVAGVGFGLLQARRTWLQRELLAAPAASVASHPELVRFAVAEAKPLFARECASCHGADMKGQTAIGAPNLTDDVWLYGDGGVFQIERTILYGVRSGYRKTHDVTEMPAFGQRGLLNETDISNVVQYLLALNGRPHDAQAATLGRAVFVGPANCGDCHAADAKGNSDYGAPDLTANVWDYGGDPQTLHDSIYYGRHGVMPAWFAKLTPEQIRALSVYVYAASHH